MMLICPVRVTRLFSHLCLVIYSFVIASPSPQAISFSLMSRETFDIILGFPFPQDE